MSPSAPPRVLHVIDQTIIGGAQVLLGQIISGLRPRVQSAVAVLGEEGPYSQEYRDAGFQVIGLARGAGRWSLQQLPALLSLVRAGRFDIVHTHLLKSVILGVAAARAGGARVIIHDHMGIYPQPMTHYMPFRPLRATYLAAYRAALRACDRAIVLTPQIQAAYGRHYPADASRVRLIANAVDPARFGARTPAAAARLRAQLGLPADTFVVVMIARLEPKKDWPTFLDVAEIVSRQAGVPCAFLAVGAGTQEAALRRAARERQLDQVHFLGYRDDVPALLNAADLFLLTSRYEPFGIVIVEAMAAGCPVVVARSGGPESIITDGVDGLLFEAGDPAAAAAHILTLAREPERRINLARSGRETAGRSFSLEATLQNVASLYGELM